VPDAILSNRRHFECTHKDASSKATKLAGSKRQMIESESCARLAFMLRDFVSRMTTYNSISHSSSVVLHDSCFHCLVMVKRVVWLEVVRIVWPHHMKLWRTNPQAHSSAWIVTTTELPFWASLHAVRARWGAHGFEEASRTYLSCCLAQMSQGSMNDYTAATSKWTLDDPRVQTELCPSLENATAWQIARLLKQASKTEG